MRIRLFLAVITLAVGVIAGSISPRSASADIGPCNGCPSADSVTHFGGYGFVFRL